MFEKIKSPIDLDILSKNAGMLLMSVATVTGMLELSTHNLANKVAPQQAAYSFAGNNLNYDTNNPLRREKEEAGPHYISFSTAQRTPGRTGKF